VLLDAHSPEEAIAVIHRDSGAGFRGPIGAPQPPLRLAASPAGASRASICSLERAMARSESLSLRACAMAAWARRVQATAAL
jgi:hypothetical protein